MQQLQGLLRFHVHEASEAFGIGPEGITKMIHVGEPALERAHIQIEILQFRGQVECPLGNHEVAAHVAGGGAIAAQPVEMDQGNHAALGIGEAERQCRPGGAAAQIMGGNLA